MKILIKESQIHLYRKFINEGRKLELYSFDWDDNILEMPTTIKMDKKVVNSRGQEKWQPVDVSTEEFATIRTSPDYRPRNNDFKQAFIDFTLPDTFLRDTKIAIENNSKSPSFNQFKNSLIKASPFSIITARGHDPEVIKKGVKMFIDLVINVDDDDKDEMVNNIKNRIKTLNKLPKDFRNKVDYLNDEQLIEFYLDYLGKYYPVSSPKFGEKFGLEVSGGAANPEHNKKVALLNFIEKVFEEEGEKIDDGEYVKVSLGFSDDDPRNVKAMVDFINNELSRMYPEINFNVYDTSKGGYLKISKKAKDK